VALTIKDIPWAGRQLWDTDVAYKDGKYYMYFPLKDQNDIFRLGVAVSDRPTGPFLPQPHPMKGSYSIDPCAFEDNGEYYLYFGGYGADNCSFTVTINCSHLATCLIFMSRRYVRRSRSCKTICLSLPRNQRMCSCSIQMANR